ncbi:MAG: dephospho-CoA kinase [Rhodospirillaceae bacterium]|nr:dephospho-CoA kinase [Rhodospirillaceae bacterium]
MIVVVLTGSIAMGKSTTASMFNHRKIPVFDADKVVHNLFAKGGAAVGLVEKHFPSAVTDDGVNRAALGRIVFDDPHRLSILESIIHPLVDMERNKFLQNHRRGKTKMVVLDIPLFYETKKRYSRDFVCVVSAPTFLQRQRALDRPGMTPQKLKAILLRQMPDHEKRKRSDFVVSTGLGKAHTNRILGKVLRYMRQRRIHNSI